MSAPLRCLPERPTAGAPRDYHFPAFQREVLANGLRLISAHVPGRPLAGGAAAGARRGQQRRCR